MRRELEGRFVLAHFLRLNTVACAKAEYYGGEGSVEQRDTTHGGQEVQRQRRTWTTWFLAHTSRCVFQCLSYFIPQIIDAKDSLACKETCQRPASATSTPICHLSSGLQGPGMPADDGRHLHVEASRESTGRKMHHHPVPT